MKQMKVHTAPISPTLISIKTTRRRLGFPQLSIKATKCFIKKYQFMNKRAKFSQKVRSLGKDQIIQAIENLLLQRFQGSDCLFKGGQLLNRADKILRGTMSFQSILAIQQKQLCMQLVYLVEQLQKLKIKQRTSAISLIKLIHEKAAVQLLKGQIQRNQLSLKLIQKGGTLKLLEQVQLMPRGLLTNLKKQVNIFDREIDQLKTHIKNQKSKGRSLAKHLSCYFNSRNGNYNNQNLQKLRKDIQNINFNLPSISRDSRKEIMKQEFGLFTQIL